MATTSYDHFLGYLKSSHNWKSITLFVRLDSMI